MDDVDVQDLKQYKHTYYQYISGVLWSIYSFTIYINSLEA